MPPTEWYQDPRSELKHSRLDEPPVVEPDPVRDPEKYPLNGPSEVELPVYVPETSPMLLIDPVKVAAVSIGDSPSFPLMISAPFEETLPRQTISVPSEQDVTSPPESTVKLTVTPADETV